MKKTSAVAQPQAEVGSSRLPLFYKQPEPISSIEHAEWRLKEGDFAFAAGTAYVPLVIGEMAAASRDYPIVFAGEDISPLALTGLERANLFVDAGAWTPDRYIPAYVRRYPFGFMATRDPRNFILALDVSSDRLVRQGEEGAPLFEDGKPAPVLAEALSFCDLFQAEIESTRAFSEALTAQNLLIDRRADATLPGGRKLALDGFKIIDADAFSKLADEIVLDWHRKGWLALVHFHLMSLERFSDLLTRQHSREHAGAMSDQKGADVEGDVAPKPARSKKA